MKKTTVHIGLVNPKTPENVGAVMRAAGCFNVKSVFYTGDRYARAIKFRTDTKNVRQRIPLMSVENIIDGVLAAMKVVCVEMVEGAIPLPEFQHPEKSFYIFGPEDGTLSQALIDRADAVVYIPTIGCLNLAATINVVLYDRLAKSEQMIANDELIRNSRDTNNKLKVAKKE